MPLLEDLIGSGRIAEIAIAVMAAEAAVLVVLRLKASRGIPWGLLANLAAGMLILLALREALVSGPSLWIAVFLTASLVAHVADLSLRWPK